MDAKCSEIWNQKKNRLNDFIVSLRGIHRENLKIEKCLPLLLLLNKIKKVLQKALNLIFKLIIEALSNVCLFFRNGFAFKIVSLTVY